MIEAGLHAPDDLTLIAHANFPCLAPPLIPTIRLGYDINALLRQALAMIHTPRVTGRAPRIIPPLPVRFDAEVPEPLVAAAADVRNSDSERHLRAPA